MRHRGTASSTPPPHLTSAGSDIHVSAPLASATDILADGGSASDSDVAQWVLSIWRGAARHVDEAPRSNSSHNGNTAVLQATAVQLFGTPNNQDSSTLSIVHGAGLKRRYRQLALRVHPDKNASLQAAEAFQLVQNCFELAMAAGAAAASWTCFSSARAPQAPARGARVYEGSASVASSAFSSSASTSPSADSWCSSRSSSSSSSAKHATRTGVSSQRPQCSRAEENTRPQPSTCSRSKTAAAGGVPEPPPVFFEGEPVARQRDAGEPLHEALGKHKAVPPMPPPPDVFGFETSAKGRAFEAETHFPPPPFVISDDDEDDDLPHLQTSPSGFAAPPPPPLSHTDTAQPGSHSTRRTDATQPPATANAAADRQGPQTRQRRGLPTLAELLAQLDADDDGGDDDGLGQPSDDFTSYQFRLPTHLDSYAKAWEVPESASVHPPPGTHSARRAARQTHTTHADPEEWNSAKPRSVHDRRVTTAAAGEPRPTHSTAPSAPAKKTTHASPRCTSDLLHSGSETGSCATMPALASQFGEAPVRLGLGGYGGLHFGDPPATTSASTTAVRSRRVGGGGQRCATFASQEQRCACGKARRGQCFLCE